MKLYDAIEKMVASRETTVYAVQNEMRKPNLITSSKCQNLSMRADGVARIADVCGYDLVLVPADSLPDGAIVIEPDQR